MKSIKTLSLAIIFTLILLNNANAEENGTALMSGVGTGKSVEEAMDLAVSRGDALLAYAAKYGLKYWRVDRQTITFDGKVYHATLTYELKK